MRQLIFHIAHFSSHDATVGLEPRRAATRVEVIDLPGRHKRGHAQSPASGVATPGHAREHGRSLYRLHCPFTVFFPFAMIGHALEFVQLQG